MPMKDKHPHYHKDVAHLTHIDVYRVLERFNVTSPTLQHAIKKLLVAGGRGAKEISVDIQEAIDSLHRFQEMGFEDSYEQSGMLALFVVQYDDVTVNPREEEAFRRVLSLIPAPIIQKVAVKKQSKQNPSARKATKRAAKAAPRRGR